MKYDSEYTPEEIASIIEQLAKIGLTPDQVPEAIEKAKAEIKAKIERLEKYLGKDT